MASKGQKFRKYSAELKLRVLGEYEDGGGSASTLAKKYKISVHTIETWIRMRKKGIDITVEHRKGNVGRPKTKDLTENDYKERYEILKKYQAFLEARREKK